MQKNISMPSLHSDIFILRDRIVNDNITKRKINAINYRHVPMQRVESLDDHRKILCKFKNAYVANHNLYNLSVDENNMRLLNKIKDIRNRQLSPTSKTYGVSNFQGVDTLRKKKIELENKKFLKRLVRIDSGLSRDKMERDFENHVKNEKIMRKIKDYERGYSPKKIKHILNHLPNLFTSPPSQ